MSNFKLSLQNINEFLFVVEHSVMSLGMLSGDDLHFNVHAHSCISSYPRLQANVGTGCAQLN